MHSTFVNIIMCIIEMRVVEGSFAFTEGILGRNWLNMDGCFIHPENLFISFTFRLNLIICQASLEDFVQFTNNI